MKANEIKLAIIGLGYVGLPLAAEFSKKRNVVGFDINHSRINDLKNFHDNTLEISSHELKALNNIEFTNNPDDLQSCNFFIVTVPTPITQDKKPDLKPIIEATKTLSAYIKSGDFVVYESTVFPGVTEEICIPIIEEITDFKVNEDFFAGYSPERINPGDKVHTLTNIIKVTSGSNDFAAEIINDLYASIISAGTYKAPSIKVAEAAKVIENTQRDLNIALVNELSKIFNVLDIDTEDVLNAAGTKWNFLPFRPGLVGGHCIGVDPYYLTHKAQLHNYEPEVILSGRRLNDGMGKYVAEKIIVELDKLQVKISESKILILGLTFKENCPDTRNSKVFDIINALKEHECSIDVCDPWLETYDENEYFNFINTSSLRNEEYDGIILAVSHEEFKNLGSSKIRKFGKQQNIFFDLKSAFLKHESDIRL
jgi:UDP-N-acetyl-D-galactosamine dehydrogenase